MNSRRRIPDLPCWSGEPIAVRVVWEFAETGVAADATWSVQPPSRKRGGAAGAITLSATLPPKSDLWHFDVLLL